MASFEGKKGLIVGVANDHSIAWAIAQQIMAAGGRCGFTHLPDRPDDERQRNRRRVSQLTDKAENAKFLIPFDATKDEDVQTLVGTAKEHFGTIDFVLHSIAFADLNDLKNDTVACSRDGFKMAMEISAYSLLALADAVQPILAEHSSILAMTYYGGEKVVQGYNIMGVCKAALDSCVKYAAYELGPKNCRVNAVSAGPLRTLAGRGAGVDDMLKLYEKMSPLGRNINHEEVGRAGAFLLSDDSGGITGEILHVDGGYNIMGSPGRLVDEYQG